MKKLVVILPGLTEEQREAIVGCAGTQGFEACFFESVQEAQPAMDGAEILFGNAPTLAEGVPSLSWICTPSAGANQFTAFANPRALLTNSSGAYGVTIAEHIVMMALELMRRQPEYNEIVRAHHWRQDLKVRSLFGSRVTLLGTGDIGQQAALRLRGFSPAALVGVNRRGRNPNGLFDRVLPIDSLDEVLPETDLLILSLPGTPETTHIMDAQRLDLLPEGSFLVNVGRGSAIDQRALESKLRAHQLSAGLDVFETEPLPPEDSLWDCPNLLITPHAAGNRTLAHTQQRIVDLFLEDFENYCAGRPLARLVNRKMGY